MYWIGTETDEVIPTELIKDEEMDLYWLKVITEEYLGEGLGMYGLVKVVVKLGGS